MTEDAYRQFEEWLQKQPYWIQDAAWYLYNKQLIDDKKIDEYIQMCILQAQKKACLHMQLSESSIFPITRKTKFSIKSVTNVKNVNALAENANIILGEEGISVIYGLNGAGKSGFMRIFKHVCGHPYAEPIQHNVYKKSRNGKSTCTINICVDDAEEAISCDLGTESLDDRLRQCDVFDTRISGAYISNSNSVSYEPFIFSVLKNLAIIAGRIEYAIKTRIKAIPEVTLAIPDSLKEMEEAIWISNICDITTIPEECKTWSKTDEERIVELKKLLDAKQVEIDLQSYIRQRGQLQNILSELQRIQNALLGQCRNELVDAHTKMVNAKKQLEFAQALFTENASEQDIISVSVEEWRNLWKIAREYYDSCIFERNGNAFAKSGSVCPLCLRKLDEASLRRFLSVDEYVNGNCSESYTKAQRLFEKKLDTILQHTYTSTVVVTMLKGIVSEELLQRVSELYSAIEAWQSSEDRESTYKEIYNLESIPVVKEVKALVEILNKRIKVLSSSLNVEKKEEMHSEYMRLSYRFWVNSQLSVLSSIIDNAKKKSELSSALPFVKTNRITTESNALAEALITDAYIMRFTNELRRLAPYLKVKLEKVQSVKGKSPYKVVLDTSDKARKSPQDVLSEGEQRIVALAAFFADATGRNELTPIIIDDPISSLDYNYEEAATKRIVELAKERQVIVFTHRISLLVGLSEQSEKEGVAFAERHIRGTLNGKGVSDFEDTYHGKIKDQLQGIQTRIRETKKMDSYSHEYIDSCSRISQQLRICVERSVEDILFQQMVKRFSRRIMTGKLLKMDRISKEDCQIIDSMMTKYSFGEHSQPEDSGLISMNLDDVIEDIDKYLQWIKDYTKKIEAK